MIVTEPRFDTNPSLEVLHNLPAFCRSFNFENQTLNKHFTGTFVNILCCFVLGWLVLEVFIVLPSSIQVWILLTIEMFWLIFLVFIQVSVKFLFMEIFKIKVLQKACKELYKFIDIYRYIAIFSWWYHEHKMAITFYNVHSNE